MGKTPVSLKVLGILGIIYASLTFLGIAYSMVSYFAQGKGNPAVERMHNDTFLNVWQFGGGAISLGLGALLMASSIGCLKCRRWARAGMNSYAVGHVLMSVVGAIITVTYLMPFTIEVLQASQPPGAPPVPLGVVQGAMIVMAVLMLLFTMAVVLTIMIIVNRKIAVDAFNGIFPPDPTNFPVESSPPPLPPTA